VAALTGLPRQALVEAVVTVVDQRRRSGWNRCVRVLDDAGVVAVSSISALPVIAQARLAIG
jgi:hypothetical protein